MTRVPPLVSARAASTSAGKSTSPHSSPEISSVHTSLLCARWWMTRRYQMVVPSVVRIAASIASRNVSAPPSRKANSPIEFGVDAVADALADLLQAPALLDHLHVVVVIAIGLAVDGDANARAAVGDDLGHQRIRNQRVAVPHQAIARERLARHVERAGIVGDLVEWVEDRRDPGPAAALRQRLLASGRRGSRSPPPLPRLHWPTAYRADGRAGSAR